MQEPRLAWAGWGRSFPLEAGWAGLSASVNTASGKRKGKVLGVGVGRRGAGRVGHQPLEGLPSEQLSVLPDCPQGPWPQGLILPREWVTWGHRSKAEAAGGPSARTCALPPCLTAALDTPIPGHLLGEVMGSQASVSSSVHRLIGLCP